MNFGNHHLKRGENKQYYETKEQLCVSVYTYNVLEYKAQNQGLILSVHWHLGNTGRPSNSWTTTSTSTLMVKVPKPVVMGTNHSAYLSLSSGFNSMRVQIIVQTGQSHPQRASYPLDTTKLASLGPHLFTLFLNASLMWYSTTLHTIVSSSPGYEYMWLINCCESHLSKVTIMCLAIL